MANNKKRFTVDLEEATYKRIELLAKHDGRTVKNYLEFVIFHHALTKANGKQTRVDH